MTGGVLFLRRSNQGFLNDNYLEAFELTRDDEALLVNLLQRHAEAVGSAPARALLEVWEREKSGFVRCTPVAARRRASSQAEGQPGVTPLPAHVSA
jgi:glutamate synthase domain-containing protein 3